MIKFYQIFKYFIVLQTRFCFGLFWVQKKFSIRYVLVLKRVDLDAPELAVDEHQFAVLSVVTAALLLNDADGGCAACPLPFVTTGARRRKKGNFPYQFRENLIGPIYDEKYKTFLPWFKVADNISLL